MNFWIYIWLNSAIYESEFISYMNDFIHIWKPRIPYGTYLHICYMPCFFFYGAVHLMACSGLGAVRGDHGARIPTVVHRVRLPASVRLVDRHARRHVLVPLQGILRSELPQASRKGCCQEGMYWYHNLLKPDLVRRSWTIEKSFCSHTANRRLLDVD